MARPLLPRRLVQLVTLAAAATLAVAACGGTDVKETPPPADPAGAQADSTTGQGGSAADKETRVTDASDPFLWLEDIKGDQALGWVEARNDEALAVLAADPRFESMRDESLAILEATDRIPYGSLRNGQVYNFWQDAEHTRGLWRRTSRETYLAGDAEIPWETVLDLDALAEAEAENWVWDNVNCRPPDFERCMLSLSRGGQDAAVWREFDVTTKSFVDGGFALPEAKGWVDWIDADTLLVATDVGEGSMTDSGYPRTLRAWKRGTPLAEAAEVFAVQTDDIAAWPWVDHAPDGDVTLVFDRSKTFFSGEYVLASAADPSRQIAMPLPEDIRPAGFYQGQLLATLRSDWTLGGQTMSAGALVAIDLAPWKAIVDGEAPVRDLPEARARVVLAPDEHTAVRSLHVTRDAVLVETLVDVNPRILRFTRDAASGDWSSQPLELPADFGTALIVGASPYESEVFLRHESPIEPEALYAIDASDPAAKPEQLATLPARFEAAGMRVEQHHATSADGTKVPYFVMLPADWDEQSPRPTYLYAYGGFEHSMLPYYRALTGRFWVERGGVFALANIRGGGEYGPQWHQAALKENRQRAFDDFHAVAADLATRGYTTPEQLGIHGGSNGGLLMGVAVTQRPELYGAAIIDVPLLDMLRYDKLLAGASWTGEYGDPDDPDMRKVLAAYSPYQNVKAETTYPRVFLTTSTLDDRVHPGHARKMAARMIEQGHDLFYYENTEGGHGGVANKKQQAFVAALKYVYLMRELGLE